MGDPFGINYHPSLEYLYPHTRNDICVGVMKLERKSQNIIQAFSLFTWTAVGVSLGLFVIAFKFAGRRATVFETFRTFISGGFIVVRNHTIVNYLSYLLSLFSTILVTAFSARFMSFLIVGEERSQWQTLGEVAANVELVYSLADMPWNTEVFETDDPARNLISKITLNMSLHEFTNMFMDKKYWGKLATIDFHDNLELLGSHVMLMNMESRTSLLHIVPQCIASPVFTAFGVRRNWHNRDLVSEKLQKTVEFGYRILLERMYQHIRSIYNPFYIRVNDASITEEPKPLKMSAIVQQLVLLCTGLTLALATFVSEIVVNKFRQRRSLRQSKH